MGRKEENGKQAKESALFAHRLSTEPFGEQAAKEVILSWILRDSAVLFSGMEKRFSVILVLGKVTMAIMKHHDQKRLG